MPGERRDGLPYGGRTAVGVCIGTGRATAAATWRRQQAFGVLGRVCGALAERGHYGRRSRGERWNPGASE